MSGFKKLKNIKTINSYFVSHADRKFNFSKNAGYNEGMGLGFKS